MGGTRCRRWERRTKLWSFNTNPLIWVKILWYPDVFRYTRITSRYAMTTPFPVYYSCICIITVNNLLSRYGSLNNRHVIQTFQVGPSVKNPLDDTPLWSRCGQEITFFFFGDDNVLNGGALFCCSCWPGSTFRLGEGIGHFHTIICNYA